MFNYYLKKMVRCAYILDKHLIIQLNIKAKIITNDISESTLNSTSVSSQNRFGNILGESLF